MISQMMRQAVCEVHVREHKWLKRKDELEDLRLREY
jgi:hypothetical protein